jgi:hypothetical protein
MKYALVFFVKLAAGTAVIPLPGYGDAATCNKAGEYWTRGVEDIETFRCVPASEAPRCTVPRQPGVVDGC